MSDESKDALLVAVDPLTLDVLLTHFELRKNEAGEACIGFTANQARDLAFVLLKQADVAQAMVDQVRINQDLDDIRTRQGRARQAVQDAAAAKAKVPFR